MSVAVRASANVVNGTAGTSVTVAKPAGTADNDVLIAVIAEVGTGAITEPAGWTLIGSQASGTAVTMAAYRKVAASEPADWTWTLGVSVRNWGVVVACTGVDTTSPIHASSSNSDDDGTDGSSDDPVNVDDVGFHPHGMQLQSVAATRTAGGSATTWFDAHDVAGEPAAAFIDELQDVSTNGGTGTDICGVVNSATAPWNTDRRGLQWGAAFDASQSQDAAVTWNISLKPAIVTAFDGGLVSPTVELALGADPDDESTWTWTDVSASVRHGEAIRITSGRTSDGAIGAPTRIDLALNSQSGEYHPEYPNSVNWPDIRRGLPLRVSMPYGYSSSSLRGIGFATGIEPDRDLSESMHFVRFAAAGKLARARRGRQLTSPVYRTQAGVAPGDYAAAEHWSFEVGSSATSFGSSLAGGQTATVSGDMSPAAGTTPAGSDPLPTFDAAATVKCPVRDYTNTDHFVVQWVINIPSQPSSFPQTLCEFRTPDASNVVRWDLQLEDGGVDPDALRLRGYDSADAVVVNTATAVADIDGARLTEADFYGHTWLFEIAAKDTNSGADLTAQFGAIREDRAKMDTAGGVLVAGTQPDRIQGDIELRSPKDATVMGHATLYVDPSFTFGTTATDSEENAKALDGYDTELHPDRWLRLNREERFAAAISYLRPTVYTGDAMGPMTTPSTWIQNAGEIEDINSGGFGHDAYGPSGELVLDLRSDRYNQPVALTIDAASAELHPPYKPSLDDSRLRTVSIVTAARDGFTATHEDATSAALSGEYPDPVTINMAASLTAIDYAAWRVALGTATGMRYPAITVNLRRNPGLVPDYLTLRPGSTLRLTNPPDLSDQADVDLVVEGITETISRDTWTATIFCSPASVYQQVGVYGTDPAGVISRYDTAGCEIASGLLLTGTTGDDASCPDSAALDIAADIDLRAELSMDDWHTGATRYLVNKWEATGVDKRSYSLEISGSDLLELHWSTDGTSAGALSASSTEVVPATPQRQAVRATLDADDGAGNHVVTFYTATDIAGPWTQLGDAITTAGTTSIHADTADVFVGAIDSGTSISFAALVHKVEIRDGIGGTLAADPDFDAQAAGTTSFIDAAGNTWTPDQFSDVRIVGAYVAGTDTSTDVLITSGPKWITGSTAPDFPLDVNIGGAQVRVTGIDAAIGPTQKFTVEQATVNGVQKSISAGTDVRLWTPSRYGL